MFCAQVVFKVPVSNTIPTCKAEEDVLGSPNLIDYALGNAQLLTKFVNTLKAKWGIGQSGQISYMASISDLLDFHKFNHPPAVVLQNFAITEVYVKRARKCLAKDMRSNWTSKLDMETLSHVEVSEPWRSAIGNPISHGTLRISVRKLYDLSFLSYTCRHYVCYAIRCSVPVSKSKRLPSNDMEMKTSNDSANV